MNYALLTYSNAVALFCTLQYVDYISYKQDTN